MDISRYRQIQTLMENWMYFCCYFEYLMGCVGMHNTHIELNKMSVLSGSCRIPFGILHYTEHQALNKYFQMRSIMKSIQLQLYINVGAIRI